MRKLVGVLVLSMVFAAYAHNDGEEHSHDEIANLEAQQAALAQQVANLEAQLANLAQQAAVVPVSAVVEAPAPVAAAPAFPRIRHSGGVGFTPRMETIGRWDADGKKEDIAADPNFRRFMFTWQYRLSVAVNEQLDLTFRLTDPSANAGFEVFGSGVGSGATSMDLVTPRLANASFTWKPASNFHFSGGLLDVASNTALDIHATYVRRNPTMNFFNTYGNSLAGFDFSFPVNPTTRLFATVGIADNPMRQTVQVGAEDTIGAHNNARIILGADLAFNERKTTVRPALNIITAGRTLDGEGKEVSNGAVLSQGVDLGFRIAPQFSLNANVGALQDVASDFDKKIVMATGGIEPVITFGGENNRLFTARVRYALEVLSNNSDNAPSDEKAVVNFIDARFAIAVNPRLSITPRFRHWTGNGVHGATAANGGWYNRAFENYGDDNDIKRSFSRFEIGFASSF
ncbi:MAG: hypothetical protein FWE23_08390 [Chitinivibrionia bacterium]|nr:hypothetical protein [Chitinivibrionia bacterium]